MPFKSFKKFCEDFKRSNVDGVLARDLNVVPGTNDPTMNVISPGGLIQFKGAKLKALNKLLGLEAEDNAIKVFRVINQNKHGVQIEDVTGSCDTQGLNKGVDSGPYSGVPNPAAPCSPTSGKQWWISGEDWDNVRRYVPSGGAGGGMGGGLGGGMPMGGGMPPPSPMGGMSPAGGPPGAPPPGGAPMK